MCTSWKLLFFGLWKISFFLPQIVSSLKVLVTLFPPCQRLVFSKVISLSLSFPFQPDSILLPLSWCFPPLTIPLFHKLQFCVVRVLVDISTWMSYKHLKLIMLKTEFMIFSFKLSLTLLIYFLIFIKEE